MNPSNTENYFFARKHLNNLIGFNYSRFLLIFKAPNLNTERVGSRPIFGRLVSKRVSVKQDVLIRLCMDQ